MWRLEQRAGADSEGPVVQLVHNRDNWEPSWLSAGG